MKSNPLFAALLLLVPALSWAEVSSRPGLAGIPLDFILFAAVLLGVAMFHQHTLKVALVARW